MSEEDEIPLLQQLRRVIKDGVDYAQSALTLLQARAAEFALSGVVFVLLLSAAALLGLASFIFLNIALGVWLTDLTGHAGWGILILGVFYGCLTAILARVAMRWLKQLKS